MVNVEAGGEFVTTGSRADALSPQGRLDSTTRRVFRGSYASKSPLQAAGSGIATFCNTGSTNLRCAAQVLQPDVVSKLREQDLQ